MSLFTHTLFRRMMIVFIMTISVVGTMAIYLLMLANEDNNARQQKNRIVQSVVWSVELFDYPQMSLTTTERLRLINKRGFHAKLLSVPPLFHDDALYTEIVNDYFKAINNSLTTTHEMMIYVTSDQVPPEINLNTPIRLNIIVHLADQQWLAMHTNISLQVPTFPWSVAYVVVLIMICTVIVAFVVVHWVTKPLADLAQAAHLLGENIHQPPLLESGPKEIIDATIAFNKMQSQILSNLTEKEEFFAAISHDLRTPITRMRLRTELLKEDTIKDKFKGDLGEMENLIQSALELMRTGEVESLIELELDHLIKDIVTQYQEINAPVSLSVNPQPVKTIIIHAQPIALRRAIQNIIENGIRYGESVAISLKTIQNQVMIEFIDNGPGIPEPERTKVLKPFYRLEKSRNSKTGGHGLGLSIVNKIIKAHNGQLSISSREDNQSGCVIRLLLSTCL